MESPMSGHRVTAPSLRMNRRELPVRVPNHRQTHKESYPVAGFHAMKTGKTLAKPAGDRNIFSLSDRLSKPSRVVRDDEFLHERTDVLPRQPRRPGRVHFDMGRGGHRGENHAFRIGRESIIQYHFTRHEWRTVSELGRQRPETAAAANQEVRQALVGAEHAVSDEKKRCFPGERAFHARNRPHEWTIGKLSDFI